GQNPRGPQGGDRAQGGDRPQGGGRSVPGGRAGARGGPGAAFARRRTSLTAAVTYRHSSRADTATFPTLGGSSRTSSWDVPVSLSLMHGRVFHQARLSFNRNRSDGLNLYAFNRDIAGEAGIGGVSQDPFDWGAPNLSFTTLTDVRDRSPSFRLDQRFVLGDTMTRTWRNHTLRGGGELRLSRLDSQTDTNARGSF